jgi:hypothetical protein
VRRCQGGTCGLSALGNPDRAEQAALRYPGLYDPHPDDEPDENPWPNAVADHDTATAT